MLEEVVAVGPVLAARPSSPAPAATPTPATTATQTSVASANGVSPSAELNPEISIVVIQFRNQSGTVELSIPSAQQLGAYSASTLQSLQPDDESQTV